MKGIAICGSTLVDKLLQVGAYPQCGQLQRIECVEEALGGLMPNVATDIRRLRIDIPVVAFGRVGNDADGDGVLKRLRDVGIDVSGVKKDEQLNTGFSVIVSVLGGQRTFFTYNGANNNFCKDDVDFERADISMLHLGYFALLEKMDNGDGLQLLREAKHRGITTSIDLVSSASFDFSRIVPCLEHVDNLIINELEASLLCGTEIKSPSELHDAAKKLRALGVRERVVIHMAECAACLSDEGFTVVPSLEIEKEKIVGTTGAGDAFCSACLVGIYDGLSDKQMLELATTVAAASLFSHDASSGIAAQNEIVKQFVNYKRKELCL